MVDFPASYVSLLECTRNNSGNEKCTKKIDFSQKKVWCQEPVLALFDEESGMQVQEVGDVSPQLRWCTEKTGELYRGDDISYPVICGL